MKKAREEIYSFDVSLEKEVEKTTTSKDEESGEKVTKTTTSKEEVPYRVYIYKPTRSQTEEADLEYSIEISNCLKKGILTKAMMLKKYDELTGGDQHRLKGDLATLSTLSSEYAGKQYDLIALEKNITEEKLTAKQKKERKQELTEQLAELRKEIVTIETEYSSLFDFTADTKAANKQVLWYLSHLTHYAEDEKEEISPVIDGETWEEKRLKLYEIEENPEDYPLESKIISKALSFVSLWYHSVSITKEDFDSLNSDIEEGTF